MKFPKFYDILDETAVEVDTDFYTTVERLRSMQGACRAKDGNHFQLVFFCSKNGRLRVSNNSRDGSANFVVGEVVEQDGKTAVKIYSVHDRSVKVFRYVVMAIFVVLFCTTLALVVFSSKNGAALQLQRIDIVRAVVAVLALFMVPFRMRKETKNQATDLETMKNELLNRIHAVERWDD